MPRETAAVSARSVYTIQPCTISRHFMQSHIRRVDACLAVTRHLHFWQNDRATAVKQGSNGYRNKSQHRKFFRRFCRDSLPRPFDYESGTLRVPALRKPITSRRDLTDRKLLASHNAQTRLITLSTASFIRQFRIISFQ